MDMKLSDRVEALQGPDRGIDAEIELAIGPRPDWTVGPNGHIYSPNKGDVISVSAYTASLDAAMTLVPDNCGYVVRRKVGLDPIASIQIGHEGAGIPTTADGWTDYARGKLPAIALTAAALRARGL